MYNISMSWNSLVMDLQLIIRVVSGVATFLPIIISIISYFRLLFRPYIIKLDIMDVETEVVDDIIILRISNKNSMKFNLEVSYTVNKHVSLVRKLAEFLKISKIKIKLLVGMGYSEIVFSTKNEFSESIAIIPKKATSSSGKFACNFRTDINLNESEITPIVELEFEKNTSSIKRFLAKHLLFRIRIQWKRGNKVIIIRGKEKYYL